MRNKGVISVSWLEKPAFISDKDAKAINRACDRWLQSRGLYIEPPMARINRERREKEEEQLKNAVKSAVKRRHKKKGK